MSEYMTRNDAMLVKQAAFGQHNEFSRNYLLERGLAEMHRGSFYITVPASEKAAEILASQKTKRGSHDR